MKKVSTQGPVNGGRNSDGPKVNTSLALVKPNYMLETPQKLLNTRGGGSETLFPKD